ncbi:MAG: hypothetical protein KGI06_03850 [Candidatus Micrarchaeota archaeon]|nr:hypothetical protein [Candidatus Micrarchaeota archaeon]
MRKIIPILAVALMFLLFMGVNSAVTPPTNIVKYIPITFTNNQGNPVTAGTPLSFTFNALAYQQYETNTLNNTELFFANGTIAPSWLEGNYLNEQQQTNTLYTSNSVLFWFKTPAYTWIGANTGTPLTNTIYLGFAGNTATTSNLLLSLTANVGVAPQLTCSNPLATASCSKGNGVQGIYGEYDDGNSIFTVYDNFKGQTISSGWDTNTLSGQVVSNGITTVGTDSSGQALSWNTLYNPLGKSVDSLMGYVNTHTASANSTGLSFSASDTEGLNLGNNGIIGGYIWSIGIGENSFIVNPAPLFNYGHITASSASNFLLSLAIPSNGITSSFATNYTTVFTLTNTASNTVTSNAVYAGIYMGSFGNFKNYNQWFRVRTLPPNSIMPAATFNPVQISLSNPTLIESNTLIDQGQGILFTAGVSFGGQPYSYAYNVYAYNSQTSSNTLIANMLFTSNSYTSNTWFWQPSGNLYIGNSIFHANVVITDSSSDVVNSVFVYFGYNSVFLVGSPTESNSIIDVGQKTLQTANPSQGTQPYVSYQWFTNYGSTVTCSGTGNAISGATSSTYFASPTTSNAYAYQVTDSASLSANTACSSGDSETTNPALTLTSLVSSNTIADKSQFETFTYKITGGQQPYTYNFIITDSASSETSNKIYTGCTLTTNSFTLQLPISMATGLTTITANVQDSATTNTQLITTNTFGVNSIPVITISPSNEIIDSNQLEVYTISDSGGTSPFTVELYNVTGSKQQGSNVIITTAGGTNTVSFIVNSPVNSNSFTFNAVATDYGTTANDVVNSITNTITVNAMLSAVILPSTQPSTPGASATLTATVTGGTKPYTYNWLVIAPDGSIAYKAFGSTSNSVTLGINQNGGYVANVLVSDSASYSAFNISVNATISSSTPGTSGGAGGGGGSPFSNTITAVANTISNTIITPVAVAVTNSPVILDLQYAYGVSVIGIPVWIIFEIILLFTALILYGNKRRQWSYKDNNTSYIAPALIAVLVFILFLMSNIF